jgi:hypothetical protein
MSKRSPRKDWLDVLSNFMAHNKGLLVFVGVGLALLSLVLSAFPSLLSAPGFGGWLVRSHALLHLGVIVGFLGILIGDAL